MTAYTDFHYSPTGSGVISGSQVLEQTEQGINGLGQYVQDNISGAIDTANQALTIAQTANTNATTALNTANSFSSDFFRKIADSFQLKRYFISSMVNFSTARAGLSTT